LTLNFINFKPKFPKNLLAQSLINYGRKPQKPKTMALIKRSQSTLFPWISDLLDEFFNTDIYNDLPQVTSSVPAVNIKETDKAYVIELAAPGLKKDDFQIELDNNVLTISYKKEDEKEEKNETYTRREFYFTEFKRSFTLPETANLDKIDAKYKDGILEITIEKKEEAQVKPKKKISIK